MNKTRSVIQLKLRKAKSLFLTPMILLATITLVSFQNCSGFSGRVGESSLSSITAISSEPGSPGHPTPTPISSQTPVPTATPVAAATPGTATTPLPMPVITPTPTASCSFNGQSIADSANVTAYFTNVSTGGSCTSETRTCSNGSLSGSAAYARCVTVTNNVNPASGLSTVNTGCSANGNVVNCDLLPKSMTAGKQTEIGIGSGTYLKFTNNTGRSLQMNQVAGLTGEQTVVAEYCVFLQDFRTGQLTAGIGEVGCFQKVPGEAMPVIRWGTTTALAVPPDATVFIGFNTDSKISMSFVLDITEQTSGVYSYRSPQIDESFMCDGTSYSTTWKPWQNTTGSNLYLSGAQIYVANGGLLSMNSACLYILDVNQSVRWSYCDGVNTRGFVSFASQTVAPNESVVGQARNSCSNAGGWDWVAYMQLSH